MGENINLYTRPFYSGVQYQLSTAIFRYNIWPEGRNLDFRISFLCIKEQVLSWEFLIGPHTSTHQWEIRYSKKL